MLSLYVKWSWVLGSDNHKNRVLGCWIFLHKYLMGYSKVDRTVPCQQCYPNIVVSNFPSHMDFQNIPWGDFKTLYLLNYCSKRQTSDSNRNIMYFIH